MIVSSRILRSTGSTYLSMVLSEALFEHSRYGHYTRASAVLRARGTRCNYITQSQVLLTDQAKRRNCVSVPTCFGVTVPLSSTIYCLGVTIPNCLHQVRYHNRFNSIQNQTRATSWMKTRVPNISRW